MTDNIGIAGRRWETIARVVPWGGAALLFLIPVAADPLSTEMTWTASDFALWAVMLLTACAGFELAMRLSGSWAYRAGAAIAIGAAFLLVWINLAVGVIGGEGNPANLLYLSVLALGLGGALAAGFRPLGMARATVAMAAAMVLVAAAAVLAGWGEGSENWPQPIIILNSVFAGMWLLSSTLFRRAARNAPIEGASPA